MTPLVRRSRAMNTLSVMLRLGKRLSSWWMIVMPRSTASRGPLSTTGSPSSSSAPVVGVSIPARIFISVDFPAPFSPNSAVTRPGMTSKSTPRRACVAPKTLLISRARMTGAVATLMRPSPASPG